MKSKEKKIEKNFEIKNQNENEMREAGNIKRTKARIKKNRKKKNLKKIYGYSAKQ